MQPTFSFVNTSDHRRHIGIVFLQYAFFYEYLNGASGQTVFRRIRTGEVYDRNANFYDQTCYRTEKIISHKYHPCRVCRRCVFFYDHSISSSRRIACYRPGIQSVFRLYGISISCTAWLFHWENILWQTSQLKGFFSRVHPFRSEQGASEWKCLVAEFAIQRH